MFMTDIYVQRKRTESEHVPPPDGATLDSIFMFQSPSISSQSASNLREHSVSTQSSKVRFHSVATTVSGAKDDAVRDWHRGLEINWRTTPLPPRDDAALLKAQQSRCASCGSELKRNLLSHGASRYFVGVFD